MLSFPTDVIPKCELTGVNANYQLICSDCTLYYASEQLAEQAWYGIIGKISHLLGPLMAPAPMIGSKDERAKRANSIVYSKRHLIDFCLGESSTFLSVKKYQLAIPAASQALRFSRELDGDTSILLVEPYLQLAQASFGLRRYKQCQEYLALAQWIVLNSEECADITRSRLHQLCGRLNATQGEFTAAKEDYSKAIYYSSRCFGAESIATSIGYFRLGDVFMALSSPENAMAFFDKVVDIWYKYLSALLSRVESDVNGANSEVEPQNDVEALNEENMAEGRGQLQSILEQRKNILGNKHIATGEIMFTLGIFDYFLLGNQGIAADNISSALSIYKLQLGEEHKSTLHVEGVLAQVNMETEERRGNEQSQYGDSQEFNYNMDVNFEAQSAEAAN